MSALWSFSLSVRTGGIFEQSDKGLGRRISTLGDCVWDAASSTVSRADGDPNEGYADVAQEAPPLVEKYDG